MTLRTFALLAGAAACLSSTALANHLDEARDKTRVTVTAPTWDPKTSAQGGCGADGCRPEYIYDDSTERESRWSCQQPSAPDATNECAVSFQFHEPLHLGGMYIAFLDGETRVRSIDITYEVIPDAGGPAETVFVGTYTSSGTVTYTGLGEVTPFEELNPGGGFPLLSTQEVSKVIISAPADTPANQWLSILEVQLETYGITCDASNPYQSCGPDAVEDRLPAEAYLNMNDDELWELLVNGKGIGLCNIRVAGAGEDTDLYVHTGYEFAPDPYVSTPDFPSGSPCLDGDEFCGPSGRSNAMGKVRDAINNGYCCLSY